MSNATEARPPEEAMAIIDRAEKRAALSPAEARALRRTIGEAGYARATRQRVDAPAYPPRLRPGLERMFVRYAEGIVYGMGTGLVAGLVAVLVTGSQLILGVGMFGGMAIGVTVVTGREVRSRRHAE